MTVCAATCSQSPPLPQSPAALLDHVQQHGGQYYHSEDDLLGVALHPCEVHPVLNDGDDEGPDQGSQNLAHAEASGPKAPQRKNEVARDSELIE